MSNQYVIHILMVFISSVFGNDCVLPETWTGQWFQSGSRSAISINENQISHKGKCIYQQGNGYIFQDLNDSCYRCVFLHQRHENVIQYKETYCSESIENICQDITGDAVLYSMFRLDSQPVRCPFHGSYTFWYNKGTGECREPLSKIDACMVESRLLLRYQACPDISGSESATEELVCLGVWKEGSNKYLVGSVDRKRSTSLENKYRCFVYEKSKEGDSVDYYVAQSGDATCNGLFSATEGSRTLVLTKVRHASDRCRFPLWATNHHRWVSLDGLGVYQFNHRNTSLRIVQSLEPDKTSQVSRLHCVTQDVPYDASSTDSVRVVSHVTRDCTSGYVCLELGLKHPDVIQVKMGNLSPSKETACEDYYFGTVPYVTLTGSSSRQTSPCPALGRWAVNKVERYDLQLPRCYGSLVTLNVGCSPSGDTLDLRTECDNSEKVEAFSCLGGWSDGNTNHLIVTSRSRSSTSHSLQSLCFINSFSDETLRVEVYPSCSPIDESSSLMRLEATYLGPCVNPLSQSGVIHDLSFYLAALCTVVWVVVAGR